LLAAWRARLAASAISSRMVKAPNKAPAIIIDKKEEVKED
jgi:hypothetical protein